MTRRVGYQLSGETLYADDEIEVRDVHTGAVVARVSLAGPLEIARAVGACERSLGEVRGQPARARERALRRVAGEIGARATAFVEALVSEAGKTLGEARGEVERAIETFEEAAACVHRAEGEVLSVSTSARGERDVAMTRRFGVGVAALITPFNFPLNLVAHKVAPAIAAGCPFVLKPSEKTPLSALLLGEVLSGAGLVAGSWSVLPCRVEHVGGLIDDGRVALVSFTGSCRVGWGLRARAAAKRVVLELGGNAACVVDETQGAKLGEVAAKIARGAFGQAGQSCISVQRVLAHRAVYDELVERLVGEARALVQGDGRDGRTTLGPMIDEASASRLEGWVRSAVHRGAQVLCGAERSGSRFSATVVAGVPDDEPLWGDEAFGPVVSVRPFERFDEAIAAVNASSFGLQAGLFTESLERAMTAWSALEVGGVVVGDVPTFRVESMPYGGVKASGVGREGVRYAIDEMSVERLLVLRGAA